MGNRKSAYRKGQASANDRIAAERQKEQRALILSARGGDQKAYIRLLEAYEPLIASMTSRYTTDVMSAQDKEDLREEAVIGFCHAVERYDLEQVAVDFGLYAKVCIANNLISFLRDMKKRSIPVDLLGESEQEEHNPADRVIEEESFRELHALIENTLTEYENAVWWSYMSGMTAKEIGERYGTAEKSASNAIYRIRRKLRKLFDRP